jgi:hypothetical protein
MRFHIPYTALGLALVAGAPAANAQTVITREIVAPPAETVITQPVQTVQTTETIRTVRPAGSRRQVVTTRTITRQRIAPAEVVARTVPLTPQPLYDEVLPATVPSGVDYSPPLYDTVAAPGVAVPGPMVRDQYTEPFIYRYVYEPGRILVVDPNTGVAVQAIPR